MLLFRSAIKLINLIMQVLPARKVEAYVNKARLTHNCTVMQLRNFFAICFYLKFVLALCLPILLLEILVEMNSA